jgi:hypothetical protein
MTKDRRTKDEFDLRKGHGHMSVRKPALGGWLER